MALTLNTRPPEWGGVNRRLVYTFTTTGGPFTNYRVEVEVFRAVNNVSLGPKFSFSPINNITEVDVSEIIKAHLLPEWILPLSVNTIDEEIHRRYYIKYQELYDGSVTSVVDDVANPRNAILGARFIHSLVANNFDIFVPGDSTKSFLSVLNSRGKIWKNQTLLWAQTISFIFPLTFTLIMHRREFKSDGSLNNEVYQDLITNDGLVNRYAVVSFNIPLTATTKLILQLVASGLGSQRIVNPSFIGSLSPWTSDGSGASEWTWNAGEFAENDFPSNPDAISSNLVQIFSILASSFYVFEYIVKPNVSNYRIIIEVYNQTQLVAILEDKVLTDNPAIETTHNKRIFINNSFDRVKIRIQNSLPPPPQPSFEFHGFFLWPFEPTLQSREFRLDIKEPCENSMMLFWKDSLGGDAFWLFDINQEVTNDAGIQRKLLIAQDLTFDEWEYLNGLNSDAETFGNIVKDFSIKTKSKIGQQVYIIGLDDKKLGVVVIPRRQTTNTRQEKHFIEIEIELPERL